MARYKSAAKQKMYDALLDAAMDMRSELYVDGKPHRGAAHRCAFWDGYAGVVQSANVVPGTLSAVAFAAGRTFARAMPGSFSVQDTLWTPGVSRQGVLSTQRALVKSQLPGKVHLAQFACGSRATVGRRRNSIHASEVTCARCLAALSKVSGWQDHP